VTLTSVRAALAGKRILLLGGSGFLGKVWLAHLLETVPDVGRVDVVLRGARGRASAADARRRWVALLERSPAFHPLHDRHGPALGAWLASRVRPVPGDVARPGCGLADGEDPDVDLVVNLAGVTGLDPDPRAALAVNADGAVHALEVARRAGAALLHVSTAYVAGDRLGRIPETLHPDYAPRRGERPDLEFSARREVDDLRRLLARVAEDADTQRTRDVLAERARGRLEASGRRDTQAARDRFARRERDRWLREETGQAARERARHWGWPNAYVYTKSLGESLLLERRGAVPLAVARPTIVESALEFPFPGWKEGIHTSAPITFALTHGPLRGLWARGDLLLDVIPVDVVARGLTLVAAALVSGRHAREPGAYHLGAADRNPFPVRRVTELTNLAHRLAQGSGTPAARLLRPEAVVVGERGYRLRSLPAVRRLVRGGRAALSGLLRALPEVDGVERRVAEPAGPWPSAPASWSGAWTWSRRPSSCSGRSFAIRAACSRPRRRRTSPRV